MKIEHSRLPPPDSLFCPPRGPFYWRNFLLTFLFDSITVFFISVTILVGFSAEFLSLYWILSSYPELTSLLHPAAEYIRILSSSLNVFINALLNYVS